VKDNTYGEIFIAEDLVSSCWRKTGAVRQMRNLPDRVEGGWRVYWTVTVSVVLPVIEPLAPVMVKV
jgi:hypothetical protein